MATLKPTTPLLAPNKGALKPASPLRRKIAPITPISHPQRRWRFQSRLGRRPQRRWRFQTRLGRRPQRRWRFQTSGPAGLQGQAAAPMGGGGAWPDRETTRQTRPQHTRPHWCGGRRRDWRARLRCPWSVAGPGRASSRRAEQSSQRGRLAGGPPPTGTQSSPAQQGTHSSPPQRAAGPSGARNTSGATCHLGITKPPGPTGAGRLSQFRKLSAESRQCRGLRGRSPGGRWKYRAWKQRPSRFPPCGGPRRRRWRSAWPSRRRSRRRCLRSRPG